MEKYISASRRLILTGIACLCVLFSLGAQNENTGQDVLYLRNGSVLYGRLLKYGIGDSVVFALSTGDRLAFRERDVKRVVQNHQVKVKKERLPKPYAFRERGFYAAAALATGYGRTSGNVDTQSWGARLVAGWRWRRLLGLGLGVGVDNYASEQGQIIYPVFAEAMGFFSQENRSFYYALRAGYGLAFTDDELLITQARGGLFANPAVGIRWGGARSLNFTTEVGYQHQSAGFTRSFGAADWGFEKLDLRYNRLSVNLGLLF